MLSARARWAPRACDGIGRPGRRGCRRVERRDRQVLRPGQRGAVRSGADADRGDAGGRPATEDECVIDRIQNANFLDGTGTAASDTVYVYLNCYANVASPQQSGYSRQSQLGGRLRGAAASGARGATAGGGGGRRAAAGGVRTERDRREHALGRRRALGVARSAQQHRDAVVDELLAGGRQPAVQVGGEQRGQRADQPGGHHVL